MSTMLFFIDSNHLPQAAIISDVGFLNDGRIDLDNNPVERAIRPVALGRKNHLFAGSDGGGARWATVCSLIATAKLNDVEPFTYLRDILQRMTDGHPMSRLDELLPWNWAKCSSTSK
jgi:transposase